MPADLQTIVQRMIDAGEPEDAIAEVIREYPTQAQEGTSATPMVAAGVMAAKAAPAIVSGVNKAAGLAGAAASGKIPGLGVRAPAAMAATALGQALQGNTKGAATTAGGAVAMSQAPKIAAMVQRATAPSKAVQVSPFVKGMTKAGPVARGAGVLSRIAGAASLPAMLLSSLYDTYQGGQAQAAQLDDPELSQIERDELLRQLHNMGGF